jgi:predicted dehydrogenase
VDRAYGDYKALIADPDVQVIHNTTPNYLHLPVIMAALEAGKHVISDKPLALNADEGRRLRDAAVAAKVAHVVTFNYRGNPLVQQARGMVARSETGQLSFIHGYYLQDWMTDPNVYSWRSDPAKGGTSSAVGDIGSHWCDLAEHISGLKIVSVLADLTTVVPVRYSSGASAEAFSAKAGGESKSVEVHAEDLASVLLRFENGAKGCFSVGQVLPGHKNDLELEINGRALSLKWRQEEQNELWIGRHDQPNATMAKDPSLVSRDVLPYVHLPGGHQESWADVLRRSQRRCRPSKMDIVQHVLLRRYSRATRRAADGKTCSDKRGANLNEIGSFYTFTFAVAAGKSFGQAESAADRYGRVGNRQLSGRCSLQAVDAG